jgi:hypothetical protein
MVKVCVAVGRDTGLADRLIRIVEDYLTELRDGDRMAHDDPPPASRGGQLELFGGEAVLDNPASPEKMRELLHELLAEVRAADTMPWPQDRVRFYRLLFPQLSFWLPEEESVRLRQEFKAELARLEAAA